jgi:alpha-L-rhamnosidase
LWDSGVVHSNNTVHIEYDGPALNSSQTVYWNVEIYALDGTVCVSDTVWFETGLLSAQDWNGAVWIARDLKPPQDDCRYSFEVSLVSLTVFLFFVGLFVFSLALMCFDSPAFRPPPLTARLSCSMYNPDPVPLLRTSFSLRTDSAVTRARAYVTGLGYYEFYLDGQRVGDRVLDPPPSNFSQLVLYSTYDITAALQQQPHSNGGGAVHAAGLMLGNGWYNPLPLRMWGHLNLRDTLPVGTPRGVALLRIDYADGQTQYVRTDESWKAGGGAIVKNKYVSFSSLFTLLFLSLYSLTVLQYAAFIWEKYMTHGWTPAAGRAPVSTTLRGQTPSLSRRTRGHRGCPHSPCRLFVPRGRLLR